jgi:hypothetical protein
LNIIQRAYSILGLKNASGTVINPATEEKQDSVIAKMPTLAADGSVPVVLENKTDFIVDLYLHQNITGTFTINTNTTIDTRTVIIDSDVLPVVDNVVCLKEGARFYQGKIVSFTGTDPYTLTMDIPLDYAFTTAGTVHLAEHDLSVDGSSTPQHYHIKPPPGAAWHITRLIIHMEDATAMDSGKFGGITALTNGVVFRKKDTTYQNFFNVKTNGEIAERAYDVTYNPKAPAGVYGFSSRTTFSGPDKRGVVIALDGATSDELEIIVQDNLTGLTHFHVIAQGHVVG